MKEELLKKIREEAFTEIQSMDKHNEFAKQLNQEADQEALKKELGTTYNINYQSLYTQIKSGAGIIMSTYDRNKSEIKEEDTNQIYYYDGTYKYAEPSIDDELGFDWEPVLRDDPSAEFVVYTNIEGIIQYRIDPKDADEFEKTHIVLWDVGLNNVTRDFVISSVNESQEEAVSLVLMKYNKKRTTKLK